MNGEQGQRLEIRRSVRRARRGLSESERDQRSRTLCREVIRSGLLLRRPRRVSAFYPADGEVDLRWLFPRLWSLRIGVYLPVIDGPRLWFAPCHEDTRLVPSRHFGIPEPRGEPRALGGTWTLDLVLMPLVAFDSTGNRIGMGGGYYDRTFAARRERPGLSRPRLVGVAFEFQRHEDIPAQPWDVPLDGVVTEEGWQSFRG